MGTHAVRFVDEPEAQKRAFDGIQADLRGLARLLETGRLQRDRPRIGAEQELCLVGEAHRPAPVITEFLDGLDDPAFATELARFNAEINLEARELAGDCFTEMERELESRLETARRRGAALGDVGVLLCGILPTLTPKDMALENLTPEPRARSMIAAMNRLREKDYAIRIEGADELNTTDYSHMFESANTSFQVHYQIDPDDFASCYNFAQAVAGPVLAAAVNSPLLFGKRLWHETRIALFQQAVDTRDSATHLSETHLRVPFGERWVSCSAVDHFEDDLATFTIFLESTRDEDALAILEEGGTPDLVHLTTFISTVFRWTRLCFGTQGGVPHLRLENRLLPAGPTVADEIANAAFWTGLMHGMSDRYADLPGRMDFADAKTNLLKAAQHGLNTQFAWLDGCRVSAPELILDELLPLARAGLDRAGVDPDDAERRLGVVRRRVRSGRTGARWQLDAWGRLDAFESSNARASALTGALAERQREGAPVHAWDLPDADRSRCGVGTRVDQFMTSDIYCVRADDLLAQTVHAMVNRGYGHVPVTDGRDVVEGLLDESMALAALSRRGEGEEPLTVGDVMRRDPATTVPGADLEDAIAQMRRHGTRCLLVEHEARLAGIITSYDMTEAAARLLAARRESGPDDDGDASDPA